jgi:hypothetical protein
MKYSTILFAFVFYSGTGSHGFVQHCPTPIGLAPLSSRSGYSLIPSRSFTKSTELHEQEHSLFRRLDTIEAAGLKNVLTAGGPGKMSNLVHKVKSLPQDIKSLTWKDVKPIKRIKSLHGPITYLILAVLFAQKYKWAWKNPAWWFGVAFCVKWFRARYVFKVQCETCICVKRPALPLSLSNAHQRFSIRFQYGTVNQIGTMSSLPKNRKRI